MELEEIQGIGGSTASRLQDQGIDTVQDLADADSNEVSVPTGNADTLIQRARMHTIDRTDASELSASYEEKEYLSTGIDGLDDILDGGLEPGTVGTIYGQSGTGKSQVCFKALAHNAAEGPVVYIDTEGQSDSIAERFQDMVDDPSHLANIIIFRPLDDADDLYQCYERAVAENPVLIVVDSFNGPFRMDGDLQGRENYGVRGEQMRKHIRRVRKIVRRHDIPVLFTGQVYEGVDMFDKADYMYGSNQLEHVVSYFIRMSEGQGELKKAQLENHPGRPEGEVQMHIAQEDITVQNV